MFLDITQFIFDKHRTGIQRLTYHLLKNWPQNKLPLNPIILYKNTFQLLPINTLELMTKWFSETDCNPNIFVPLVTKSTPKDIQDNILIPEVFLVSERVEHYRK